MLKFLNQTLLQKRVISFPKMIRGTREIPSQKGEERKYERMGFLILKDLIWTLVALR